MILNIPHFFWWLKYNMNHEDNNTIINSVSAVTEDFNKHIPDIDRFYDLLGEVKHLFNIMALNLEDYAAGGDDIYLQMIEKTNGQAAPLLNDIYKELEFFNYFTSLSEELFLEKEAARRVENSSLFIGLKHLINAIRQGTVPEEDLWDKLDDLRDTIYDIQEGELAKLIEEMEKKDLETDEFTDLFETGLLYMEEALEMIERAFQNKKPADAEKGLSKIWKGLVNLNILEMIIEAKGVLK